MLTLSVVPLTTTSCVVPPPLKLEPVDAAANSPPVIVSTGDGDLAFPGPVVIVRGDQRRLTLNIVDADVDDTVYVNIYVNYGKPTPSPPFSQCLAPAGSVERVADCSLVNICNPIPDGDTSQQYMEALVSDRPLLPEGEPAFRALDDEAAFSFTNWQIICGTAL